MVNVARLISDARAVEAELWVISKVVVQVDMSPQNSNRPIQSS
jgi:hypothetical protein